MKCVLDKYGISPRDYFGEFLNFAAVPSEGYPNLTEDAFEKKKMPGSEGDLMITTGSQVDAIVLALIDATFDKNDNVTSSMCNSLYTIGKHQPNLVLSSCHSYLQRHPRMPLAHKILVLSVMDRVCVEALKSVHKNVALDVIKQAVEEIVNTKEVVPEWQGVASNILVSLGRKFHHEVMEYLLVKFQPGVLPHFYVLHTMANLASVNVFGMIPFFKAVLGMMLPLLCTIKQENMKWIFAFALARFSEAILECMANIEKSPDPSITKEAFMSEINSAYDVLFNNWLQSREAKVRAEVAEALGHMTQLLNHDKLEEIIPKFIPAILGMYRRQQEYQHTTQGLCMVLDAAVNNQISSLETQIDAILSTLFPQVCTVLDYSQPSAVRNHNEVLRCFAVLARAYSDRLITFLLLRLEINAEGSKIGALTVLKHLINSCDDYLIKKMHLIISSLKLSLDSGNKVKKVIAQVIVALAHHGHLDGEGGSNLVWFIVQQCALADEPTNKRPNDPDYVSNEALRGMCENVIHLLTTTVEKMQNIIWPNLLDCLVCEDLTSAITPLCKSLAFIGAVKQKELDCDFYIDFASLANIPGPQTLIARLLVLVGHPHADRGRGVHILRLLLVIAPGISKILKPLWETKIPIMIQELEDYDGSNWNQELWEEHLMNFLNCTLEEIDREEWTFKLGKAVEAQFPLYISSPNDKYMLLKILGLILKKVGSKNFISHALDSIFENVNHSNDIERRGCALAVGYCGASHLDAVLVKMEQVVKDDRKSSSLFSFIKDFKWDYDNEKLKATIILCYGYVTMYGPVPFLTTRVETPILRNVATFYQSSKELVVKLCMLETIKLIANAVHPSNLQEDFVFRSRNELLNLMKSILKSEATAPMTSPVRSLALEASASLVALNPPLSKSEKSSLLKVAISTVYTIPLENVLHIPKREDIDVDFDHLLYLTLNSLNLLLTQLLLKEKTHKNLETMLQQLQPWLISKLDLERKRSMQSTLHLLKSYTNATENDPYSPFCTMGYILGILVPRCTDPQMTVRHLAFDSIDVLLSLAFKTQAFTETAAVEQLGISLNCLKQEVSNDDPSSLFTITKELGKVISEKLPVDQICPLLSSLSTGLCDPHSQSSSGASVVLNKVIKLRGREIRQEVPGIFEDLLSKFGSINCPRTHKGALLGVQNLALHHLSAVLTLLLNTPLPFQQHIIYIWRTLAQEKSLANLIIDHFLELLSENVLVNQPDPHGRQNTVHVAVSKPLIVVCALKEIFEVADMEACAKENFDKIFSTLVLVIGNYVGVTFPPVTSIDNKSTSKKGNDARLSLVSPVRCAIEALRNFLLCVKENVMETSINEMEYWAQMELPEKYPDAIAALGRSLCVCAPKYIPKILVILNPSLSCSIEVQRIVTISLFVEFLSQSYPNKNTLIEPLINNLLGRLVDSSHIVRKLCIRGLGSIGLLQKDQVQRYSTTILSAMMAGMDDKDDPNCDITLEAMSGLSSVLLQVAEEDVRGILINITLRVKPMFDTEKAPVRSAAFTLFGNLSRFGNGPSREPFIEQVHHNLIPMLLHLNDEDKQVIKSCKYALKLLGPLLESPDMNSMFQKHLMDDAQLHYGEFINDLTKTVIADFPDRVNFHVTTCLTYLRSSSKCNATAFLGYLLGNMPVDKHSVISKEKACAALIMLLKDSSPEIRIQSAESLSLLYNY